VSHGDSVSVRFSRDIQIRHNVDVFIAGGGPAGVAAALAAARLDARLFLAEGHSCLGGMGTAGMVPAFMMFADGENFCAGGIGREIYDRFWEAGGTGPDDTKDTPYCSCGIRAEVLKRVYDDMLVDAGVPFALHTQIIGVETDGDRVTTVICWGKSGLFGVRAKMYVDATGDGDLAVWAGASFEKGDDDGNLMPGTLCSIWTDIDWPKVRAGGGQGAKLEAAFEDGVFTYHDRHLPGMWRVGENFGGGNIGHTYGVDATDERSLTAALVWGRKLMLEYERYYKTYLDGFQSMDLLATGSLLGIRETRRIMGDYVLNIDDFRSRNVFADEIGRYCYPVDIHPSKPDPEAYARFEKEFHGDLRYSKGESYGIPYRALLPRGLTNVLVSGRCISSDRYIQGSVRVMPGCFITGQAAGVAAAIAAQQNIGTRDVATAELQQELKQLGAFLPNAG